MMENERDLADLMAMRLVREGNEVETAFDDKEGLDIIRANPPDLAIIDMSLPGMGGPEIVKELRADSRTAAIPIIMLTAKHPEGNVGTGLQAGQDEYITKPLSLSALAAAAAAVLKRAGSPQATEAGRIKIGGIAVDQETHRVEVAGKPVLLTLTEFRLLAALAAAKGRVLTRDQMIDLAMGMDAIVTDRTVDVHLAALRKKLGKAGKCLRTVRGVGYRLSSQTDETA